MLIARGTHLPPPALAWRFVARGALVWLLLRAMTLYAMATLPDRTTVLDPALASTVVIAIFAGAAVWIDARRRRELHFLANLGVSGRPVLVLAVLPVLVLEVARAALR